MVSQNADRWNRMARKSRRSQATRGSLQIAKPRLRRRPILPRSPRMAIGDRRLYTFDPLRPPRMRHARRHRLVVGQVPRKAKMASRRRSRRLLAMRVPSVVAFRAPRSVGVCIRRQERREVIHAKGVAGSKVRKGKRNKWSNISCKRSK